MHVPKHKKVLYLKKKSLYIKKFKLFKIEYKIYYYHILIKIQNKEEENYKLNRKRGNPLNYLKINKKFLSLYS